MNKAKLLKTLRATPCLACGKTPSDAAHVRSKKASGESAEWNLIPLCRTDHRLQHSRGWVWFLSEFPKVKEHLEANGWGFQEFKGRLIMYRAGGI